MRGCVRAGSFDLLGVLLQLGRTSEWSDHELRIYKHLKIEMGTF